ncbi:MAG: DUF2341 domain-containing protein, partial [Thermoplasmata archaeon]
GQDFDGEDDYIDCGYDTSLDMGGAQITLEAWINFEGYDPDHYIGIMSHSGWAEGYRMVIRDTNNALYLHLPEDSYWVASDNDLQTYSWVHVVGIYNGSKMFIYVNGVKNTNEQDKSDDLEKSTNDFWIGHGDNSVGQTWSYPWNGSIDEVRVSNFTRSADWIATEYNNQNDTASFYTVSDEEFLNDAWLYKKNITINSSQVESDLTYFPVLISITDSDLANKANIEGNDIYFTKSDGTTRLNHEIESYESTAGELVAWVNITSLSSSSDTYIYMHYGKPNCFSIANPEGVWDSAYVGVWHLGETYGTIYDSTSNDFDATTYGDLSLDSNGKIAGGSEYNGTYNNSVNIPDDSALEPSSITVECWWSTDVLLPSDDDFLSAISKSDNSWNDGYIMCLYRNDGSSFNGFMFFSDFGDWAPAQWDISNVAVGSWYYAAGTYNSSGDVTKLFINGSEVDSASSAGAIVGTSVDLNFGTHDWEEWDGKLDEIRISNIVRSDAWLNTTYNCQHNTSTFISVGNEESSGASPEYEWVEVYNGGNEAINVSGWYITDNDGNKFYLTGAGEIASGEYLVCHLAESGTNSSTNVYGPIVSDNTITSITLQPGPANCEETTLDIDNPAQNYGYGYWMHIEDWDSATGDAHGVLKFDLSGFTSNNIIDANLWMYRYDGSSTYSANISACRMIQSWEEHSATWNAYDGSNNWYNAGGDFNPDIYDYTEVFPSTNGWYKWNITGLIDGWKDGIFPNYGMILLGNDEAGWQFFRTSDNADDHAVRPKLIINYTVTTPQQLFMLEETDDLALYDNNGYIIDYVAWGADVGADDDSAFAWRHWTAGDYIDSSSFFENQTLGRDQNENDTDEPEDWENATGFADPFGIDRSNENGSSPNACNVDFIIPEFEEVIIPLTFMILIVAVWRRKRKLKSQPKDPPDHNDSNLIKERNNNRFSVIERT